MEPFDVATLRLSYLHVVISLLAMIHQIDSIELMLEQIPGYMTGTTSNLESCMSFHLLETTFDKLIKLLNGRTDDQEQIPFLLWSL